MASCSTASGCAIDIVVRLREEEGEEWPDLFKIVFTRPRNPLLSFVSFLSDSLVRLIAEELISLRNAPENSR